MRFLLVLTSFLITYGSLYPFAFDINNTSAELVSKVLNFNFLANGYTDSLANFLLFVPWGFLAMKSMLPENITQHRYLYVNVAAFLFAYSIQVFQLWTPERVPHGGDALWNLLGSMLGAYFATISLSSKRLSLNSMSNDALIYFVLGSGLILLNWSPFVPTLDFGFIKNNLKTLIFSPQVSIFWVLEKLFIWLTSFYFLSKSNLFSLTKINVFLLVFVVLVIKIFIINSPLQLDHIVGAALAYVLWFTIKERLSNNVITFFTFFIIIGLAFYPFELRDQVGNFKWLPFSGSLNGNVLLNILAMTKKSILYACLVWTLYKSIYSLIKAASVAAIFVFICEYLQIFFTNSVPEITDAFLVMIAGYIFHVTLKRPTIKLAENNVVKPEAQSSSHIHTPINQIPFSKSNTEIAGMDGLRAIAASSVFFVHFYQQINIELSLGIFDINLWMYNGNTGVALFFILSGFLLSMPFWKAKQNNECFPDLKSYFIRRAARILPAYYFCLISIVCFKFIFGGSLNFNDVISHFFFLHNLKDYQVLSLNQPFWTLAVEVHFYLLLPLFFLALKRLNFNKSVWFAALAVPLSFGFYVLLMKTLIALDMWPINFPLIWPFGVSLGSESGAALRYATTAHLPHFILGVVTAAFFILQLNKGKAKSYVPDSLFWLASLCVFIILSTPLDNILQIEYGRYNFPYVPILLAIIVCSAPFSCIGKRLLTLPWLAWLGRISYGIYMYHYLVLKGVNRLFSMVGFEVNDNIVLYGLVSFILSALLAFLSFKFIEMPVIRWVKSKTNKNEKAIEKIDVIKEYEPKKIKVSEVAPVQKTMKSQLNALNHKKFKAAFLVSVIACFVFYGLNSGEDKTTIKSPSWASIPAATLIFDHHTHTNYSDGELSIEELVELAYFNGCDAIAITDHTGIKGSISVEKFNKIDALRVKYAGLKILGGIELGMPSYQDREHVNILSSPEVERALMLEIMKELASDDLKNHKDPDQRILDILTKYKSQNSHILASYNHPSRKDESEEENIIDIANWNKDDDHIIAISGAPGHQNSIQIGSYKHLYKTVDRWDPAVANIGGAWDKLLSSGQQIWGAVAPSDFHNLSMDKAPCDFSRIHVNVPENSYAGLLQGIKAGTFWADHGKLLKELSLSATFYEESGEARVGSIVTTPKDSVAEISIHTERDVGGLGEPLFIELISNCRTGKAELFETKMISPIDKKVNSLLPLLATGEDNQSCYVRARLRKMNLEGPDTMAYTNHIRFVLSK